ncbi:MAG TPA: hypothetical protein VK208_03155 [Pyrinomonadaceae bacterium]|jgi:hypothetical protein|nr:hypothetical protein [Pyrinomonadaceae bacterium]
MKIELVRALTMVALVVVFAVATAVGSANPQAADKVVANIPFEFSVGYKTMPAGEYSVKSILSASNALLIQSADGKRSALRLSEATNRAKDRGPARLVFHRYGERYFLAQVWNGAENTGRQLIKSQEERAIERELAGLASADNPARASYETVEIVAVLR